MQNIAPSVLNTPTKKIATKNDPVALTEPNLLLESEQKY